MSECKHEVWTFPTQPVSVCEECERTSAELEYEKRIETLEAERDEWRDHANKLAADRIALEAENKALREQFSRDMDFANKSYGDLKAENARLLERVAKWETFCKEWALTKEELWATKRI